jgi:ATP-binding cassette subfamily B protein
MSRLVNDVTAVRMLLGPGILNFINTPVYYAYGLTIMCSIDPVLTVTSLAVYPMVLYAVKRTSALLMERTLRVQEGLADLSSRVQENLSGIHVVKAYGAEAYETQTFQVMNERFQEASLRLARMRSFIGPLMNIVGGVGALVVLWLGGRRVLEGRLSVGDLVAFVGYLHLLAWPTMALGWMLSVFQRGRAAMQRLNELFSVEPAIASAPRRVAHRRRARRDRAPRRHLPLSGQAGRSAHPGPREPSHSGRTDGRHRRSDRRRQDRARAAPAAALRRRGRAGAPGRPRRPDAAARLGACDRRPRAAGPVPLLADHRREHRLRARDDGAGRIEWAVGGGGLDRDLADMPAGLDTVVGERGITLSGGQKQRVTLARVLAARSARPRSSTTRSRASTRRPSARSSIACGTSSTSRTTLLVAHRITTVKEADEIVVLTRAGSWSRARTTSSWPAARSIPDLFRQQALETSSRRSDERRVETIGKAYDGR